jgi:hypothetical protein
VPPTGSLPAVHVNPATGEVETVYVNFVPFTVELSEIAAVPLLHIVCVAGVVAVMSGMSLILIV